MPRQADPTILVGTAKAASLPASHPLDFQDQDHLTASVSCNYKELPLSSPSGRTSCPIEARSPDLR